MNYKRKNEHMLRGSVLVVVCLCFTSCTESSKPASPSDKQPSMTSVSVVKQGIAVIDSLYTMVADGPISPGDIAETLGVVEKEISSTIYVIPSSPHFSKALITLDRAANRASEVMLVLSVPGSITIASLVEKYGDYSVPPAMGSVGMRNILFDCKGSGEAPYDCILAVMVEDLDLKDKSGKVLWVTIVLQPK